METLTFGSEGLGKSDWFSNYAKCENGVEYDGEIYPTVEHAWAAAKTADPEIRAVIAAAPTANAARKLGRSSLISKEEMEARRDVGLTFNNPELLEAAVRSKVERNPRIRELLLATGSAELIDGPVKTRWGWHDPNKSGKNTLGNIWMRIRAELEVC